MKAREPAAAAADMTAEERKTVRKRTPAQYGIHLKIRIGREMMAHGHPVTESTPYNSV